MRQCVIIESPYAGNVEKNVKYARACMYDSLLRGESPFLSHLLYTQVLDDTVPEERIMGFAAAQAWYKKVDKVIIYTDLGVSPGMSAGVTVAQYANVPVEYRKLGENWENEK